jgi:hypothetical protein
MKYYIFRVENSIGEIYYLLNNQFIGYIGFDSNRERAEIEYKTGVKNTYVLVGTANFNDIKDRKYHKLNCDSHRFTNEEYQKIKNDFTLCSDPTIYEIYYPSPNSSVHYLREKGGKSTKFIK